MYMSDHANNANPRRGRPPSLSKDQILAALMHALSDQLFAEISGEIETSNGWQLALQEWTGRLRALMRRYPQLTQLIGWGDTIRGLVYLWFKAYPHSFCSRPAE